MNRPAATFRHLAEDHPIPPGADALLGFDFQPRTRIVFGPAAIQRTAELARTWDAKRVLLVTDPGIVAAGHAARLMHILQSAGLAATLFDHVRENPTTEDVDRCLAIARPAHIDTIIALGGGSSMDTAKACNFLLTNGGVMHDYWGTGKATKPMLPLIAIPTTAGTGSECQSYALIADAKTHIKMACGDPKAAARVAILDPELTVTQPRHVTANTGIDTLTHAVETAVTTRRTEISQLYSRESLRLTVANLPRVLEHPTDLEARGHMLLAAAFAGTAIENSMLGAAHAAANPLTAHCHTVHGQAVGLMLPAVVRYNSADPATLALYSELALHARLTPPDADPAAALAALLATIHRLLTAAHIPASLAAANIPESLIPKLADEAAHQWTAQFNPRPITAPDFAALYQESFRPR